MDKFTNKLQMALADAQSLAVGKDHNQIAPVHLMSSLVNQKGGSIKPLLMQTGFDIKQVQQGLQAIIDDLPVVPDSDGDVNLSQELAKLLNIADKISQQNNDQFISSENVLLAAMQEKGELGKLLNSFSVSKQALENAIKNFVVVTLVAIQNPKGHIRLWKNIQLM
jgi:ATP-dependent Clp protease ATP-binding subunit ClpB